MGGAEWLVSCGPNISFCFVCIAGRKTGKAAGSRHADSHNVPAEMMSQFRAEPDADMLGVWLIADCLSPPLSTPLLMQWFIDSLPSYSLLIG